MWFDSLMAVNIAIALVALARLRPSLFIIAGNQATVLRALASMERYGQPTRQNYLPASLYTPENFDIAAQIFLVATVLLSIAVLRRGKERPAQQFISLPRPLQWLLGLYFLAVIVSSKTILTNGYTDPERVVFNLNLSGIHALLAGLVVYEVYRRVHAGQLSTGRGMFFMFALFFASDYLKGGTGFPTGALTCTVLLCARHVVTVRRRAVLVLGLISSLIVLSLVVRGVREGFHADGTDSVQTVAHSLVQSEDERAQMAEGAESAGNGSQYAAHVLECINLYEAGVSRAWRSIYSPLEYTLKPSVLAAPLGFTRSTEAAVELSDYYIHGGGIYVLGELYWNGGMLCVILVFAFIVCWAFLCDTRSRSSWSWCLCLCTFDVGLLQGVGYGFAQVSRGIINGLLAVAFLRAVTALQPRAQPLASAAKA